jgi:GNAT superfamily N-acetyltransferase
VAEPLLDHPRALMAEIAGVLGGRPVDRPQLKGFLNSRFDRFLNQLFASGTVAPREAAAALDGRPGFVWLAEPMLPEHDAAGAAGPALASMCGMAARTAAPAAASRVAGDIVPVRSPADVAAWHEVYCEVFHGDARGRDEWSAINDALGPSGDGSLALLVAYVDGSPAATGGVYFRRDWAGLYCFTTREGSRGRGLASALVQAAHEAARERGIERALLHATPMGRPIYARCGYSEVRPLPLLVAG